MMDAGRKAPLRLVNQRELDDMIASHERWLASPRTGTPFLHQMVDFTGLTFKGNLKGARLLDCVLVSSTFNGVRFDKTAFLNCNFSLSTFSAVRSLGDQSEFRNCNFTDTTWDNANLASLAARNSVFSSCTMSDVTFVNASLDDCGFQDAKWETVVFAGGLAQNCGFENIRLNGSCRLLNWNATGSRFLGLDLKGLSSLQGTKLLGCVLDGSRLDGVILGQAGKKLISLAFSRMKSVVATGASFIDVDVEGCDFSDAQLSDAQFRGSLRNCKFIDATLLRAEINQTSCERTDFTRCDLRGAEADDLKAAGATFVGAQLGAAILTYGDFRAANFTGADFDQPSRAILGGSDFDGAIWSDGRTCRPGSLGRCI